MRRPKDQQGYSEYHPGYYSFPLEHDPQWHRHQQRHHQWLSRLAPPKVKKERSEAQKAVLEKARAMGLEVRLQKAKERKEAKERALQEVVEKYKKKEEVVKPEPEVEEVVEPSPEVKAEAKVESEPEPEPEPKSPLYVFKNKRLTYNI